MRRWSLIAAGLVVATLLSSQVAIPRLGASAIEDRLTERGGEAEVSLSAVPAARLLFDDGDRLEIVASGLDLELDQQTGVFDRLDGFGEIEIEIADFAAGPIELASFDLVRDGSGPYRLAADGEASPGDLVSLGAEGLGLPGGSIAGAAVGGDPLPIELEMELASAGGELEVVSGGGTVAGISTGLVGELVTVAIVSRL